MLSSKYPYSSVLGTVLLVPLLILLLRRPSVCIGIWIIVPVYCVSVLLLHLKSYIFLCIITRTNEQVENK